MKQLKNKSGILLALVLGLMPMQLVQAQEQRKMADSHVMTFSQVRVEVISVDEEVPNQGLLRMVGECDPCGLALKFDDGTNLVTPFYRGEMDTDVLRDQQFAYAVVKLNTSSFEVLEINYMSVEY